MQALPSQIQLPQHPQRPRRHAVSITPPRRNWTHIGMLCSGPKLQWLMKRKVQDSIIILGCNNILKEPFSLIRQQNLVWILGGGSMTGQAWRLSYWGARAWKPTGVYAYGISVDRFSEGRNAAWNVIEKQMKTPVLFCACEHNNSRIHHITSHCIAIHYITTHYLATYHMKSREITSH